VAPFKQVYSGDMPVSTFVYTFRTAQVSQRVAV
jgi:hypothetical protein